MACWLAAPDLDQCWLITSEILGYLFTGNFNGNIQCVWRLQSNLQYRDILAARRSVRICVSSGCANLCNAMKFWYPSIVHMAVLAAQWRCNYSCCVVLYKKYRRNSNTRRTSVGSKMVDHNVLSITKNMQNYISLAIYSNWRLNKKTFFTGGLQCMPG